MSQSPFGVLLTQPQTQAGADAPWLIRQTAITHIPSVGAWLAVKQVAKAGKAPEALLAWGDPVFRVDQLAPLAARKGDFAMRQVVLTKLEDVLSLKLNADWVVLSACNTAAADVKEDEALSGLARGFFYAGSRSLLVTHWAVESDSARLLTTATFEHYTQHPEAAKAESLRQAMLKLMANPAYAHPAYWAPFALVGDGGR